MAITDLTNTTWLFNDNLSLINEFSYSIDFMSDNINYNYLSYRFREGDVINYINDNDSILVYYDGWANNSYKTIHITGGTDVTNTDLISWLENNATQITVDDLTGTKWIINETPNWFSSTSYEIDFVTNNETEEYNEIQSIVDQGNNIYYLPAQQPSAIWNASNGWLDSVYRTIEISGGNDSSSTELIAWLSQNAQQVLPSPTLTYDLSNLHLEVGTYDITVKAVGEGYKSSGVSNSVSYTVEESGYQVTFTASNYWSYSDDWSHVYIYDGQDNTGTLLLHQNPANKSAFPMILTITSGHCYIELEGAFVNEAYVTSSDFNVQTISSNLKFLLTIDKEGTVDISIKTFDE